MTTIAITSGLNSMQISTVLSPWAVFTLCHQAKVRPVAEGPKGTRFPIQSSSWRAVVTPRARMVAGLGISCSNVFRDTVVSRRTVLASRLLCGVGKRFGRAVFWSGASCKMKRVYMHKLTGTLEIHRIHRNSMLKPAIVLVDKDANKAHSEMLKPTDLLILSSYYHHILRLNDSTWSKWSNKI